MQRILEKTKLCYRYRDFNTAIFMMCEVYKESIEYNLLLGILFYENKEYKRSIHCLKEINGTTSLYYRALAHKNIKEYSEAIKCVEKIYNESTFDEISHDNWISSFLLSKKDTEFLDLLIGELLILKGKAKLAIDKFRRVIFKNPLLRSVQHIFDENMRIESIDSHKDDPIMRYFIGLCYLKSKINTDDRDKQEILFYKNTTPGSGSYYLSKLAVMYFNKNNFKDSMEIFEFLREQDKFYIYEMDIYSTILWKFKKGNFLGLLSKELMESHPKNYITWIVLGNFYSLNCQFKECSLSLTKSISIQESSYAYTLLGFEYNSKNQFLEAQAYFKSSLCMLENNDKALFGLGISYAETFKKEKAEQYFKKAISLNPDSKDMKTYLVRFYVKSNNLDQAYLKIREFLNIKSNEIMEIVDYIVANSGRFSELDELMVCELAEVYIKMAKKEAALKVLESVESRTSSYYSKRALIENTE